MPGEFAEFEAAEYEARWARARAGMAAAGLGALFISSECNYRYLSGHVTPFWVSKTRNVCRARCNCDFDVPDEMPSIVAISSCR